MDVETGRKCQENVEDKTEMLRLIIVCILCFIFMIVEVVGGMAAGSLALLSDASHLLADLAGFGISLAAIVLARRPATLRHSFGFHRAEAVGAIFSVSLIWFLTFLLLMEAVEHLRHPKMINGTLMFVLALMGLIVNIIMAFLLHHNHNHSLNIHSAFIHVLGDIFQSAGVLVASILVYFFPSWTFVDSCCTFIFSILVLITTLRLVRDTVHILMEGTPTNIDPSAVKADLCLIPNILVIHDMHIWCISPRKLALTLHVVVENTAVYSAVLGACQNLLCHKYGIHHSTIQLEIAEDRQHHCISDICAEPGDIKQ